MRPLLFIGAAISNWWNTRTYDVLLEFQGLGLFVANNTTSNASDCYVHYESLAEIGLVLLCATSKLNLTNIQDGVDSFRKATENNIQTAIFAEGLNTGCKHVITLDYIEQRVLLHNSDTSRALWTTSFNKVDGALLLGLIEPSMDLTTSSRMWDPFIIPPHTYISFSFELMKSTDINSNRNTQQYKKAEVRNLATCSSVLKAVGNTSSTIAVEGDASLVHTEYSMGHWLDVCGAVTPVVRISPLWGRGSDIHSPPPEHSHCTVRYVTGIKSVYNFTTIAGDQSLSSPQGALKPLCLEDVYSYTTRWRACQAARNASSCMLDQSGWQQCRIEDVYQHDLPAVQYITSLRFLTSLRGIEKNSNSNMQLHASVAAYNDLLFALRAFNGTTCASGLVVKHVVFGEKLHSHNQDKGKLTRALLQLLISRESDAGVAVRVDELLHTVQERLILPQTTIPAEASAIDHLIVRALSVVDALMSVFGADFSELRSLCAQSRSPNGVLCYRKERRALQENVNSFVFQLAQYLNAAGVQTPILRKIISYTSRLSDELGMSPQGSHYTGVLSLPQGLADKPLVRTFVDGDVHVLIYVRPEHLHFAQRLVAHWQRGGAEVTNFLFVKYMIFPLESSSPSSNKGGKAFFRHRPSLRSVLLLIREKVEQVVTAKDLVYVLIGLDAALSFPQPGRYKSADQADLLKRCLGGEVRRSTDCDSNLNSGKDDRVESDCNLCGATVLDSFDCSFLEGVIPAIPYGGAATYHLDGRIVFGAAVTAKGESPVPIYTAFAGLGYSVRQMVQWVQAQEDYAFGTDATIERILDGFVESHPMNVHIDCQQRTIHSTKASHIMSHLVAQYLSNFNNYGHIYERYHFTYPNRGEGESYRCNDSVAELLAVLSHPIVAPSTDAETMTDGTEPAYARYKADMRVLLNSYLSPNETELVRIQSELRHSADVLSLLHFRDLPYVPVIATRGAHPDDLQSGTFAELSDSRYVCHIDDMDLQEMVDHITSQLFEKNKILSAALATIATLEQLVLCDCRAASSGFDATVYIFVRIGQIVRHLTSTLPLREVPLLTALLEVYDESISSLFHGSFLVGCVAQALNWEEWRRCKYALLLAQRKDQILAAVRFALTGLQQESCVYPGMVEAMARSLRTSTFQEVSVRRQQWHAQREHLVERIALSRARDLAIVSTEGDPGALPREEQDSPRVHYVTFASDHTEGLQNLLMSAELAGIRIEVLGVGTTYVDYSSKTDAYWNYLQNSTGAHTRPTGDISAEPVPNDDIVLFVDAYDVLVFPAIANAAKVLAESPSPLLFCAERGIYPEFTGSFFYQRGLRNSSLLIEEDSTPRNSFISSPLSQKFLNSGCILGRAGQLKQLMGFAKKYGRTYRDDQLAMVRYQLERPDEVALDSDNHLFLTNFKSTSAPNDLSLSFDLRLMIGDSPVGLLHCNNMRSGSSYHIFVDALRRFRSDLYSGEDGPLLLRAVRMMGTGQSEAARAMLEHPIILRHCATHTGSNPARANILFLLDS